MNESDYNYQIDQQQSAINSCNRSIQEMENRIAELTELKKSARRLQEAGRDAANATVSKIHGWPELFRSASTVLNIKFFNKLLDAVKGDKYVKADSSLTHAQEEIQKKIDECRRVISDNQGKIRNCRSTMNSLNRQKAEYLKKRMEEGVK